MEIIPDIGDSIEVLRIKTRPGCLEFLRWIPSVKYDDVDVDARDAATRGWERSLVHVPDLFRFGNRINLRYRRLFHMEFTASDADSSWTEDYYIYKCIEPRGMEQPKNRFFEDTNAFGDVFVFTLNRHRRLDTRGNVKLGSMKEFARSLTRLYAEDMSKERMLRADMWRTGMTREELERESLVREHNLEDMLRY